MTIKNALWGCIALVLLIALIADMFKVDSLRRELEGTQADYNDCRMREKLHIRPMDEP